MEVLSDNSSESTNSSKSPENEENKSSGSEKSNQIEKSNQLVNIYQVIRNIINKYPFIQYYIKVPFYFLFCIGIYYLSRRTSLLMSPYLMNNEYYRKISGIHDIATN